MANRQQHLRTAALTAGIADTVFQLAEIRNGNREEFDFLELVVVAGAGALAGITADILEPATSSWHRKTIHSVGIAIMSAAAAYHPKLKSTFMGRVLKSAAFAHCSHLLLDARTPRGVPWLLPKVDRSLGLDPFKLNT